MDSTKLYIAATGGDTVKLFDISVEPLNPCILAYSPSPGSRVNSVKWNHNNLVLASAGEDSKISLWKTSGQSLWTVPAKNSRGEIVEPSESVSAISFSNKGSRYLCSGGSGQVVRIWDLQNKRCVKWLKGHTDTITGVMYNCKDEHIASISRKGDLILHNLSSGTKAAELRDPNGQDLSALDYSRVSRHLLVTAGDDGSVHMWDTTGRSSPKVSWLKQHSAPTSGVSFSPTNDKIIASVGLDMKLYTFDSGSRKPSSCIPYEAPLSSLAFSDDGLTLAAGTSTGQVVFYDIRGKPQPVTVLRAYGNSEAIKNLCWQRSKPVVVNEQCTDENVLLAGDLGDSVLMPDPLPSRLSMTSGVSGSQNPGGSSSGSASSAYSLTSSEVTPIRSMTGGALLRLNAPRSYNHIKDDMEVFSPLVEVQPITPSFDKLWDDHDGLKRDQDRKSFLFPSRRYGLSEDGTNDNHPMFGWKSNSSSKQDDMHTPVSTCPDDSSSITPPEAWGGERVTDKYLHHQRQSIMPSRFALSATNASSGSISPGLPDSLRSTSILPLGLSINSLKTRESLNNETPTVSEALSSPLATKNIITGQNNLDTLGPTYSYPMRPSSYAERIGSTLSLSDPLSPQVGTPKSKKTGAQSREELLNSVLSRSETPSLPGSDFLTNTDGGAIHMEKNSLQSESQNGTSFTLQLFQRTLEETVAEVKNSIHEDVRNVHIELIRQFHLQEMKVSNENKMILEMLAEMSKEIQALRQENQRLLQLL